MERHRRNHYHHQRVRREGQQSTVKIVYITAKQSFTGKPAGFSTIGNDDSEPTSVQPPLKVANTSGADKETHSASQTNKPMIGTPKLFTTSVPETDVLTASSSFPNTFRTSYIKNTIETTSATGTGSSSTSVSTSAASYNSETNNSGGSIGSIGAVVGGTVAGILALLLIAAFFYRKRKQKASSEAYSKPEDEKFGVVAGGDTSEKQQAQSPRLSTFNPAPGPATTPRTQGAPVTLEVSRKPVPAPLNFAPVPVGQSESKRNSAASNAHPPLMPAAQPSPTLSAFSDAPPTIPGTPTSSVILAGSDPNPVHRVTMDFQPSMPDELGLRAGCLVRMLHEYDDGWALCTRLDRSQQGVCPRTCLSVNPVKPRPRPGTPGSPGGPNAQRRGPRNGHPPSSQHSGRPDSPGPQNFPQPQRAGSPQKAYSRPQTPTGHVLPQITVSTSLDPIEPPNPTTDQAPVSPAPQSKESSPLAQQFTPVTSPEPPSATASGSARASPLGSSGSSLPPSVPEPAPASGPAQTVNSAEYHAM